MNRYDVARILSPSLPPLPCRLTRVWPTWRLLSSRRRGMRFYGGTMLLIAVVALPFLWMAKLAAAAYGLIAYLMWVWLVWSVWTAVALPWYLVSVVIRTVGYLLNR